MITLTVMILGWHYSFALGAFVIRCGSTRHFELDRNSAARKSLQPASRMITRQSPTRRSPGTRVSSSSLQPAWPVFDAILSFPRQRPGDGGNSDGAGAAVPSHEGIVQGVRGEVTGAAWLDAKRPRASIVRGRWWVRRGDYWQTTSSNVLRRCWSR